MKIKFTYRMFYFLIFIPLVINGCTFDLQYYQKVIKLLNEERNFANEIIKEINNLTAQNAVFRTDIDYLIEENRNLKIKVGNSENEIIKIKSHILNGQKYNLVNNITPNNDTSTTDSIMKDNASIKTDNNIIKSDLATIKSSFVTLKYFTDNLNSEKYYYMYSQDIIVYRNIYDAIKLNIASKLGNPDHWDETSHSTIEWNNRKLLRIGIGLQTNSNGLQVNVPAGYNLIWICHLSDRRMAVRVQSKDYPTDIQTSYGFGKHNLNEVYPDGSMSDSSWNFHKWMPLVLYRTGVHYIHCDFPGLECWFSGIAFGKNILNHAKSYIPTYFYKLNGGDTIEDAGVWNNDELGIIKLGNIKTIYVPIIPNGKDKLLYYIAHNNNWDETITNVLVNYKPIERFKTTYVNPFSIHINSKISQRYYAAKISKDYYGENDRFVKVTFDTTTLFLTEFYFRAIGSHDFQ